MEEVKNRDFFWFENRGKLMPGVQTASNVSANAIALQEMQKETPKEEPKKGEMKSEPEQ